MGWRKNYQTKITLSTLVFKQLGLHHIMDAVHFLQRQTLVRNFLDKFPCKMTKRRTKHVSRHIPPSFLKSQLNIMLWLTINNLFSWRFRLRKALTKWIQNLNAYTNPSSLMSKTCIRSTKVAGKYFKAAPLKKKTQINVGARLAWRKTFVSFVHWIRPSCDGWSRGGSQHGKRVYNRACLFFGCVRGEFQRRPQPDSTTFPGYFSFLWRPADQPVHEAHEKSFEGSFFW